MHPPNRSYVKGYEPWAWIVGSGIYTDDVGKIVRTNALLAAGFVGSFCWWSAEHLCSSPAVSCDRWPE